MEFAGFLHNFFHLNVDKLDISDKCGSLVICWTYSPRPMRKVLTPKKNYVDDASGTLRRPAKTEPGRLAKDTGHWSVVR